MNKPSGIYKQIMQDLNRFDFTNDFQWIDFQIDLHTVVAQLWACSTNNWQLEIVKILLFLILHGWFDILLSNAMSFLYIYVFFKYPDHF